jgi:RHS repeat-associated protein
MYYTDQWQVLEERQIKDMEWLLNKQYVWGIRYIDELILRDNDTAPIDGTLNIRHYALQDANFNVVALINTNGSVGRRFEYDAYGHSITLEADFTPGAYEYDFEYRYAGYRWDYETYLLQVRNRWYHPRLGRWLSRDPIGYAGGTLNLYEYVDANPVGDIDAFGMATYKPGQGTCHAGYSKRGYFASVLLMRYDDSEDYRTWIGTGVSITWRPNTLQFIDSKGCCCCDRVGFAQVVQQVWRHTGHYMNGMEQPGDFKYDHRFPYHYSETGNPCQGENTTLRDQPSSPRWRAGWLGLSSFELRYLSQTFETCAVCVSGSEEPNKDYSYLIRGEDVVTLVKLSRLAVYGCVRWGHYIYFDTIRQKYDYSRWVGDSNTGEDNSAGAEVTVSKEPGSRPSKAFSDAVESTVFGRDTITGNLSGT